ncbi:hypothetical protein [Frankia sp. QA3]|uniref:hypothetical protein n=1 Tax=Frankia sp. QA3 TaxID=710111 RepID=UPI00030B0C7F|nr:hypothetical protein [Frankia sp. QA3]
MAALEDVSFRGATLRDVSFRGTSRKYRNAIRTVNFDGARIDKLTYAGLKGLGVNVDNAQVACTGTRTQPPRTPLDLTQETAMTAKRPAWTGMVPVDDTMRKAT